MITCCIAAAAKVGRTAATFEAYLQSNILVDNGDIMEPLTGLLLAALIGSGVGLAFYLAIRNPLAKMLEQNCAGNDTVRFWGRFTQIMLFISPLFVAIAFGLPSGELMQAADPASLLVRIITSSLVGGFLAMIGMGFWVASIARQFAMWNRQ